MKTAHNIEPDDIESPQLTAFRKRMAINYPKLAIGSYVNFRHVRTMHGRIIDMIIELPTNHPHGNPYGVFLIRLDNGVFVTEWPEYLDPSSPPVLTLVKS